MDFILHPFSISLICTKNNNNNKINMKDDEDDEIYKKLLFK